MLRNEVTGRHRSRSLLVVSVVMAVPCRVVLVLDVRLLLGFASTVTCLLAVSWVCAVVCLVLPMSVVVLC